MSDTKWKPWQSWNPAWKPPWTRSVETLFRDAIAKIAKDQKVEDVERELVITLLAKAKKGDIKALEIYLDRLYWKPKQKQESEIKIEIDYSKILDDIKTGKINKENAYNILKQSLSQNE